MASYDYDLIVIGSGAGGSVAAHLAKKGGLSVAVIEEGTIGGECPNVTCIPTKALLHAAHLYDSAKQGHRFGIRTSTIGYNYPSIKAWKDLAVKRTGTYLEEDAYTKEGVHMIRGRAHFIDEHTVSIGTARFSAKYFLIATGSTTIPPEIPGLKQSGCLTYKDAPNLTRPPRSIAIIGGGATGCEFAQLFAAFGTKVYIIESGRRILSNLEPEAATALSQHLSSRYSTQILTSARVAKVSVVGTKKRIMVRSGNEAISITVDEVLVATGKTAALDLGLENAGVSHQKGLIATNSHMQTTAKHIFAAGDCTNGEYLTHLAAHQGKLAVHNILYPRRKNTISTHAIPRVLYTNPEIASVGLTQQQLKKLNTPTTQVTVPLNVVSKANVSDFSGGFIKVIAHQKTGVLLGATLMCPGSSEAIHELTLAIQHSLTAAQVAETIHAFPTWSELIQVACSKLARQLAQR